MVIEVRLEQHSNALDPIEETRFGMVYSVSPAGANALRELLTIRHLLSVDANLPLNSLSFEQPRNAESPIEVTLFGMVIEVRLVQPSYLQLVISQYFASNKSEIWS